MNYKERNKYIKKHRVTGCSCSTLMTGGTGWRQCFHHLLPWEETIIPYWLMATPCWSLEEWGHTGVETWSLIDGNIKATDRRCLTLSACQRSTLAAGHCLSDNIDMASQHNENLLMPCAAVMMKLTERTELLFVLFRAFDMCQCPRIKGKVLSGWCQSL